MNPKSILNLFSILVLFFSFSFLFPIIVSIIYEDGALHLFVKTLVIVASLGFIGLFFTRNIKNELSQKDTILEESRETKEGVTTESALKWLNDPKRRKASFYSSLDEAVDINIDETRRIYLSEINS